MRVLVTRPEPGAGRTARLLAERGFEPLVVPLTRIVPLPVDQAVVHARFHAVAVTSASAIRNAPAELVTAWRDLPAFAVGESTADAARRAGFSDVRTGPGDAAGLSRLMVESLPAGAAILYPCGRVRRPDFASALRDAGLSVTELETYDTLDAEISADGLGTVLDAGPIDAVLIHSQKAAAILAGLADRRRLAGHLAGADLCCISERAAAPLARRLPARIRIAAAPTEDALLALLDAEI